MPILAGLGPFGPWELALILLIVVLIFGVGRLPEVGGAVGKGIREFRKSTRDDADASQSDNINSAAPAGDGPGAVAASSERAFCTECGTPNARTAKFCSQCGHAMTADVR